MHKDVRDIFSTKRRFHLSWVLEDKYFPRWHFKERKQHLQRNQGLPSACAAAVLVGARGGLLVMVCDTCPGSYPYSREVNWWKHFRATSVYQLFKGLRNEYVGKRGTSDVDIYFRPQHSNITRRLYLYANSSVVLNYFTSLLG